LVSLLREEKHFWAQELDGVASEFPYDRVLDIFVRVNSGGTKLDASDLMFAAMKEGWSEIEEVIEETTELLNGTNLRSTRRFHSNAYSSLTDAEPKPLRRNLLVSMEKSS
jgi:hypothetical protein